MVSSKAKKVAKPATVVFDCVPINQGIHKLYVFAAEASVLWSIVGINQKIEDKDEGYQRVLSPSRTRAIANYIKENKPIPLSVLVTFDFASVAQDGRSIAVPNKPAAGWVIDGQHRLAGAHEAKVAFQIPVVAFVGLDLDAQVEQFVTINREAKGVPTSLYYDLLKHLPEKSKPAELAKERAADIAHDLKTDEESAFFGRIVVTTAPKRGELSLNNFVRKVSPLVLDGKGPLSAYSANEQRQIISNYYKGLELIFPKEFAKQSSTFFQTLGFGALMNALPVFFNLCLKHYSKFRVEEVARAFKEIQHFDFSAWEKYGSGSAAEIQGGEDIKSELQAAFDTSQTGGIVQLT